MTDQAARRIGALAAQLVPNAESQARVVRFFSYQAAGAHAARTLGAHQLLHQPHLLRSPTSLQAPHGVKVCVVGSFAVAAAAACACDTARAHRRRRRHRAAAFAAAEAIGPHPYAEPVRRCEHRRRQG